MAALFDHGPSVGELLLVENIKVVDGRPLDHRQLALLAVLGLGSLFAQQFVRRGGTDFFDDPVVEHSQGVQNDFHPALLDHRLPGHFLFSELKVPLGSSKKGIHRIQPFEGAVRCVDRIALDEVHDPRIGDVLAHDAQGPGTVVPSDDLKQIRKAREFQISCKYRFAAHALSSIWSSAALSANGAG